MNRDESLRRLLQAADPAAGRELTPAARARMRALLTSAACAGRRGAPSWAWVLAGLTMAAAAVAAFVLIPNEHPRTQVAVTAPAPAFTPLGPERPLQPVTRPEIRRTPRPRPVTARLEEGQRKTQILFTGPDGTRIFWLVGSPDAKELGS
jgi:hypothetical protein